MPNLPTYQSQRQLSTEKRGAVQQGAADTANIISQGIGQVKDISQKWVDAIATVQYTTAKANSSAAYLDLYSRASQEPDFSKRGQYLEEANKIASEAMDSVKDQRAKNKLYNDLTYESKANQIKINAHFNAKEIESGVTKLEEEIETNIRKRLTAGTDAEKEKIDIDTIGDIMSNQEGGIIDSKQAKKYKESYQKLSVQYEITRDESLTEEVSGLLDKLDKGEGLYGKLPTDVRLGLIKELKARIYQNNQTYKRDMKDASVKKVDDILLEIDEGTATIDTINELVRSAQEDEDGPTIKEALRIKKGFVKVQNLEFENVILDSDKAYRYSQSVNKFIENSRDKDRMRQFIVESFADGDLSPKEAKFWNDFSKIESDFKKEQVKRAFKEIFSLGAYDGAKPDEIGLASDIRELVSQLIDGVDPDVAAGNIITDKVATKLGIADWKNIPSKGEIYLDPAGNKLIVFPDRSYKEIE